MSKTITFKSDLKKKLLLFSSIPLLLLSLILIGKMYIVLEDSDNIVHKKLLRSINYKLNSFYVNILEKTLFFSKHSKTIDGDLFIKFNKELDSVLVLDKKGVVLTSISDKKINFFRGFDYSNKNIFKQFKETKEPFFSNIYFSTLTNKQTVSYIFENKDNIFIFNINIESIKSYIEYLKDDSNLTIIVVDSYGKYVVNTTSNYIPNIKFFSTYVYKKGILNKPELEYTEIYNEATAKDNHIMYLKNKTTKWTVLTIEHNDDVDSTILVLTLWISLFIIIILIIMKFRADSLSHNIVEPLEIIIDKMKYFANLEETQELSTSAKYPLFIQLEQSFNIMQNKIIDKDHNLRDLNNSLEEKVKEQTKKLKKLNNSLELRVQEEVEANKEKEQILFEQSKMAAMGEMLGNISHQWRQPLSAISTIASGVKLKHEVGLFDEEEFYTHMDKIVDSTVYLSNTIDDFRNFFKKDKTKSDFRLKGILETNANLLEASLKNSMIKIELDIEDITLYGYQNEMIQAFLNVLNNAKDALSEKDIKDKVIVISNTNNNDNVQITVKDNAGGIKNDVIDRIFEPYFTTKHKSQGTGIGLYMTREIIVKHMKGKISVTNETFIYKDTKYTGACFNITVPLSI